MRKFRVSQVLTVVAWLDIEAEDFDDALQQFRTAYPADVRSETIAAEDAVVDDAPDTDGVFDAKSVVALGRRRH